MNKGFSLILKLFEIACYKEFIPPATFPVLAEISAYKIDASSFLGSISKHLSILFKAKFLSPTANLPFDNNKWAGIKPGIYFVIVSNNLFPLITFYEGLLVFDIIYSMETCYKYSFKFFINYFFFKKIKKP